MHTSGIKTTIENLCHLKCSKQLIEQLLNRVVECNDRDEDRESIYKLISYYKRKVPYRKGRHQSIIPIYTKICILNEIIFKLHKSLSLFAIQYLSYKYNITPEAIIKFLLEISDELETIPCIKHCKLSSQCSRKILNLSYRRLSLQLCEFNLKVKRLIS
jgi:hypothetical protein